jgi:hypothetical protein
VQCKRQSQIHLVPAGLAAELVKRMPTSSMPYPYPSAFAAKIGDDPGPFLDRRRGVPLRALDSTWAGARGLCAAGEGG